jgi:putative phosphoribosyl transferase
VRAFLFALSAFSNRRAAIMSSQITAKSVSSEEVEITFGQTHLAAIVNIPLHPRGVVIFAHGSGSGRLSPRNQFVARELNQRGFATVLADLLEADEADDQKKVFDVQLLSRRLHGVTLWTLRQPDLAPLKFGYFGASTGAAAALIAAARHPEVIDAVVSRGGRPDLVGDALASVNAPTLLVVGGDDEVVLGLNEQAESCLTCRHQLVIVPNATHLFEQSGTLEEVARLASNWFKKHLGIRPHDCPEDRHCMFSNREDAGRRLAEKLKHRQFRRPLVLAIPRGGIPVGAAIAEELNAELDVVLCRKLRAPEQPELAIGAIDETGHVVWNDDVLTSLNLADAYLEEERLLELSVIDSYKERYRQARPLCNVKGRSVIVTDDGIATGATMIAALEALRKQQPFELIAAIPVASPQALENLKQWCDETICLVTPSDFFAIGHFYEDFHQLSDRDAILTLRQRYACTCPDPKR